LRCEIEMNIGECVRADTALHHTCGEALQEGGSIDQTREIMELTYLFPIYVPIPIVGQCRFSFSHPYVAISSITSHQLSPTRPKGVPSVEGRHFSSGRRGGKRKALTADVRSKADLQSSYTKSGPNTAIPTPVSPFQTQTAKLSQKTPTNAAPPARAASRTPKATTPAPPLAINTATSAPAYRKVDPHNGPPNENIASPNKSPRAVLGDLRPQVYHPHEIPLPRPRSIAPTVYSGYSPARTARTLKSEYDYSPDISQGLPGGHGMIRSRANTNATNRPRASVYIPTPPKHMPVQPQQQHHQGSAQDGVAVIDFAQHALQRPLPDSRPTTVFSAAPRRGMSASVTVSFPPPHPGVHPEAAYGER
jgi:hypothetical protein